MNKEKQNDAEPSALPAWAKVLVGLFISGVIASIVLIGLTAYLFTDFQKNSTNPERLKVLTRSIVKMDQLPPGFRYERGYPLPAGSAVVMIMHDQDGTMFTLTKLPNSHGLDTLAVVDQLPNDAQSGGKLEVRSKGKEVVAGQDLQYVLGTMKDNGNVQQLRGAIVLDEKKNVVKITGSTPHGPYNMDATKQLLAAIKGF